MESTGGIIMGIAGDMPESRQRDSWHAIMDGMAIHAVPAEIARRRSQ